MTDRGLDWLKNGRDKNKPFMLMLQNKAPHREWSPKPSVYESWKGVEIPEPATLFKNDDNHIKPRAQSRMSIANHFRKSFDDKTNNYAPGNLNPEQKAAYRAMFAEENAAFEKNLPELHAELDRLRKYCKVPEQDPAFLDRAKNGY